MTLLGCARQLTGLVTISRQQAGDRDVFAQRLPVQAPAADPARFPLLAGATQKAREPSERNTQRSTIRKLDPHAVLVEPDAHRPNQRLEARIWPPSLLARHGRAAVHAADLRWNRRKIESRGLGGRLA